MIGPITNTKNSRYLLNQPHTGQNPITTWSRAFSRAWRRFLVFLVLASCSHWFIVLFSFAVIGHSDSFGLMLLLCFATSRLHSKLNYYSARFFHLLIRFLSERHLGHSLVLH